ncbi:MAG TPA: response regulator [Dissulfurispiraceae bacterium]|nr:response regulator [Dissulfurispiraceae bacterium]
MALNILVVDDSSIIRSIVIRSLKMSGLQLNQVHQAENGREALGILENNWIDLAFVDINMPIMNGIELIEAVRRNPSISDLPIIVVSTESSTIRIEMLKEKKVRFVHKPFSPEVLCEAVIQLTGVTPNGTSSDASF